MGYQTTPNGNLQVWIQRLTWLNRHLAALFKVIIFQKAQQWCMTSFLKITAKFTTQKFKKIINKKFIIPQSNPPIDRFLSLNACYSSRTRGLPSAMSDVNATLQKLSGQSQSLWEEVKAIKQKKSKKRRKLSRHSRSRVRRHRSQRRTRSNSPRRG